MRLYHISHIAVTSPKTHPKLWILPNLVLVLWIYSRPLHEWDHHHHRHRFTFWWLLLWVSQPGVFSSAASFSPRLRFPEKQEAHQGLKTASLHSPLVLCACVCDWLVHGVINDLKVWVGCVRAHIACKLWTRTQTGF